MEYDVIGKGESLVIFLHGWIAHAAQYDFVVENLDLDAFKYIFLDYRGYGKNIEKKGSYDLVELATDCCEVIKKEKCDNVILIAHSMGGLVAQKVATMQQGKIKKIMLVAPVPYDGFSFDIETRDTFLASVSDLSIRSEIVNISTGNRLTQTWIKRFVTASSEKIDHNAYLEYFNTWTKGSVDKSQLSQITSKVIIAFGEFDPVISKELCTEKFSNVFLNSEFLELKNTGHYPMQEVPIIFSTFINNFLKIEE